jgi:hypothetical protein
MHHRIDTLRPEKHGNSCSLCKAQPATGKIPAAPSIRSNYTTSPRAKKQGRLMNFDSNNEKWQKVPPTTDKSLRFQQELSVHATPDSRAWLRVSDVVEHVALWLDDRYLGDSETPFQPRVLELPEGTNTAMLNVEFVELDDIRLPHIELLHTGPIRIGRHKVLCTEANNGRGTLDVHVELDTNMATLAWIRTVVTDHHGIVVIDDARRHAIAIGKNRLRWNETLDEPQLWQKFDPSPALYTVTTSVGLRDAEDISDACSTTTGFRTVLLRGKALHINDTIQPLVFLAMDGPPWPTPESRSMIRFTRVNDQSAYDQADARGILVCQRLPENLDHARQVVDLLAHHPGIVAWSRPRRQWHQWRPNSDTVRRAAGRTDGTRPFLFE